MHASSEECTRSDDDDDDGFCFNYYYWGNTHPPRVSSCLLARDIATTDVSSFVDVVTTFLHSLLRNAIDIDIDIDIDVDDDDACDE